MLGHFRRHLAQRYHVIEDALQLAVALDLHRRHQDAGLGPVTLVSADQALNSAATVEGLTVDDPRSHP